MKKVAVIGAGISGAACSRLLRSAGHEVVVFEAGDSIGGLVQCTTEKGNLFHRVGGHVFNAKEKSVSDWFWAHFDQEAEFLFSRRNAAIFMRDRFVGYPIENHIYQLEDAHAAKIISELLHVLKHKQGQKNQPNLNTSFKDFLLDTFGQTLCDAYFIPYNNKIWRLDLATMPIEWLDGKLPMPRVEDIISSNILRREETEMVHSRFYYPKEGGSQFTIDRLMEAIDVRLNSEINSIDVDSEVTVLGEKFDAIVYTGDVRKIADLLGSDDARLTDLSELRSNGTTTALCSCDVNPYSWIYLPEDSLKCHRIIMTGNFAPSNNSKALGKDRISCTVEFVGQETKEEVLETISRLPFNLELIDINYEPNSYVIQSANSREQVTEAKRVLADHNIWLCGRFAEWEYYNMDAAIAAAMKTITSVNAALEKKN